MILRNKQASFQQKNDPFFTLSLVQQPPDKQCLQKKMTQLLLFFADKRVKELK